MIAGEGERPLTVFMIVAHNHPALLARLVKRLLAPWTRILVAIDAKVAQAPFQQALEGTGATFLAAEQRVDVQWGGIGLTTATVRMMRVARDLWSPARYCLLSGVDYPIKPIDEIGLALVPETERVRIDRKLDAKGSTIHDAFIRFPSFNDVRILNPRSSPIPKLRGVVTRIARRWPRQQLAGFDWYHGCGWWCVTRTAAEWLLGTLDARPDVMAWLRHVNCPDEIIVQTLLKASPVALAVTQDFTVRRPTADDETVHGCHYIDWRQSGASFPKTLDRDDLERLLTSPALFARKIDPLRSASLLDALDEMAARPVEAGMVG